MNITIISVGKLKERYLKDAIEEYAKRLSRYCSLNLLEVADEKAPEHLSENDAIQVKQREGEKIQKHVKEGMYVIALDLQGSMYSSELFAEKLEKMSVQGNSQICFIIGGSLGLSDDVLARSKEKISFSKMTFPHQLMRLILLEQVYRAYKINKNEPYHK